MRRAGDVCFSQVYRERDGRHDISHDVLLSTGIHCILDLRTIFILGMRGIVDYTNYDDMKYAVS